MTNDEIEKRDELACRKIKGELLTGEEELMLADYNKRLLEAFPDTSTSLPPEIIKLLDKFYKKRDLGYD